MKENKLREFLGKDIRVLFPKKGSQS